MPSNWFHALTGFEERSFAETQANLSVETPSLADLRTRAADVVVRHTGTLRVSTIIADVTHLHCDPAHRHALFQVASQFNLLEMTGPDVTPEDGVARYAHDRTQGPACAIAAGGATIYRNYLMPVDGQAGQTRDRQVDCLRDLGAALGNLGNVLWTMRNGYALCTRGGLAAITRTLAAQSDVERDALRDLLRVGVHQDVEVTIGDDPAQLVTQVFCSALPVSYTSIPSAQWEPFARLVLEGAYEATLWAAVLNAANRGLNVVFLTQLGGGAFGNETPWIHDAIRRALRLVQGLDLDVRLVSYRVASRELSRLAAEFA